MTIFQFRAFVGFGPSDIRISCFTIISALTFDQLFIGGTVASYINDLFSNNFF